MPGLAHPHTLHPHTLQYSYDIEHSYEIQQQYDVHYEFDIAYEFSYEFGQPSLFFPQHSNLRQPLRPLQGPTTVIRVVSGDTLRMLFDVGEAGARLIGINAPERQAPFFSEPFADEAKRFVENLIGGRRVWIELDEQLRDAAGNFLIYLYVEDPQGDWEWQGRRFSQVNLLLAQQGLATIGVFEPNDSYSVLYNVAVQQAVAAQVGKWQSRH